MILVIRISGQVDVSGNIAETMFRARLRRKYSAVLMHDNAENRKLLKTIRNHVAFGTIRDDVLEKLLAKRGKSVDGKAIDSKKVALELEKKDMEKLGLKPFFRLHPPRGGIDTKKHFGVNKGVLGDNKEKINDLVEKML